MTEQAPVLSMNEDDKIKYYREVQEGLIIYNKNDYEKSLEYFNELVGKWGEQAEIVFCLGILSYDLNRRGHALNLLERAHKLDPDCKDYADVLAFLYTKHGKLADGLYFAKLSMTLDGHPFFTKLCPEKFSNYALALQISAPSNSYLDAFKAYHRGNYNKASELCNMELQINPRNASAMELLAKIQLKQGFYFKALQTLRALSHLKDLEPEDNALLAKALVSSGFTDQARTIALNLADRNWRNPDVLGMLEQVLPLLSENKKLKTITGRFEKKYAIPREEKEGFTYNPHVGRKIRLGFLCDFAYGTNEAGILLSLLEALDRNRFEVFLYTTNRISDNMTTKFSSCVTQTRAIEDIDTYTCALTISEDSIDILFDAAIKRNVMHTEIMAERPSPVQLSWTGCAEPSAGIGADVVLSDVITQDIDKKYLHPNQKTALIRSGFVTMKPFSQYPDVIVDERVKQNKIVYGVYFDPSRITSDMIFDWSEILKANKDAVILFGHASMVCDESRIRILSQFGNYGLAERVRFVEYDAKDFAPSGQITSLEFLENIDVLLDTAPVSGIYILTEALWMGVPVITLRGNTHSSCMGASILNSAGHYEWVAKTRKEYVRKAISLTKNGNKLFELREKLRSEMLGTTLFNPAAFAREFENTCLTIVNRG